MSWSIPLGRVLGTEIRLHLTFLLLLAWIGLAHGIRGGMPEAIQGVAFIALIFACVLLHEFGHVLAARRYGIATPDITLLPIGGVARLDRIPEKPAEELVVALAGPAVNVAIATLLLLPLGGVPDVAAMAGLEDPGQSLLARLFWVNVTLVVFNLIPAFPMDGGRVLRALLGMRLGGEPIQLTRHGQPVERFEWSGDGRYIVFLAAVPRSEVAVGTRRAPIVVDGDGRPHQLWLVEVATGKVEPLTTGTHHIVSFGWSLDGTQIVYAARHSSRGTMPFSRHAAALPLRRQLGLNKVYNRPHGEHI